MEEERNTVQNKKSGKTVAIVILVILVLGLAGYISYDKYFYKYFKKNEVKEPTKLEVKETKEEKASELEFQSISDKVKILTSDYQYESGNKYNIYLFSTSDKITLNDLPKEYKIYTALENCNKYVPYQLPDVIYDADYCNIESFDKIVKETYGDKITIDNITFPDGSCPIAVKKYQDNVNEYYLVQEGCGNLSDYPTYYLYNVTKKDKKYYAYVAVGYVHLDNNVKIYKNLENDEYSGNTDDFQLNESNYKEFSKYKITFEEDSSGNYIFKESARIEK